jgi:hypothetical protein
MYNLGSISPNCPNWIDKPKDISVCIQVKKGHTLLQESDVKEDISREQEEEDENKDDLILFKILIFSNFQLLE